MTSYLQASMDDGPSSHAKSGSTEVIRTLLREQKRECSVLRHNPIFQVTIVLVHLEL